MYISLAVFYSVLEGFSRLFVGAHSMDQIIFGWLLGAWLALTYFTMIREYIHGHIQDLTTGQTASRNSVYYLISSAIFATFTLIVTLTFVINMNKSIKFPGGYEDDMVLTDKERDCSEKYDFWSSWAESAYMSSGLGGYFGILHQHKKYGGQLFIQQKIDQLRKNKIKRFIYRFLIVIGMGSPVIIMTIVVYSVLMP